MKNFHNKVVVITGAGSGIGRALAQEFKNLGARLALNDYNETTLRETVGQLALESRRVMSSAFDVSDRDAMFRFANEVIAHFGEVDVVVNNAGLAISAIDLTEVDLDKFRRVMDVNFGGVLYGSKAFLPHLEKRVEAALVNVSSVYGLTGVYQLEAYVSSKFAVNGLTQSLIQAYRGTNVSVHGVYPGGIKTNITRNALDYQQRNELFDKQLKHSPQYAAGVIVKGIRKKKRRILIGSEAYVLDFLTRLSPIGGGRLVNKDIEPLREQYRQMAPNDGK